MYVCVKNVLRTFHEPIFIKMCYDFDLLRFYFGRLRPFVIYNKRILQQVRYQRQCSSGAQQIGKDRNVV